MENSENINTDSYLTFKLGDEVYAVHVSKVLNILEMTNITKVPKSPDYMKGVINLRGMVLPVIDTRKKFGMKEVEYTDKTCIVVMDLELDGELVNIGTLVDEVVAVLEIEEDKIEAPPALGKAYRSDFLKGVARVEDEFIMILDMIRIFSTNEIINMQENLDEVKEEREVEIVK